MTWETTQIIRMDALEQVLRHRQLALWREIKKYYVIPENVDKKVTNAISIGKFHDITSSDLKVVARPDDTPSSHHRS